MSLDVNKHDLRWAIRHGVAEGVLLAMAVLFVIGLLVGSCGAAILSRVGTSGGGEPPATTTTTERLTIAP